MNIERALELNRMAASGGTPEIKLPENTNPLTVWDEEWPVDYARMADLPISEAHDTAVQSDKAETYSMEFSLPDNSVILSAPSVIKYPELRGDAEQSPPTDTIAALLDKLETSYRLQPQRT